MLVLKEEKIVPGLQPIERGEKTYERGENEDL